MAVVTQDALYRQAQAITGATRGAANFTYAVVIHARNVNFQPFKLVQMDRKRTYATEFMETCIIKVFIGQGQYNNWLYPARNDFTVTITQTLVGEVSSTPVSSVPSFTRTYRGTLLKTENQSMQSLDTQNARPSTDDALTAMEIEIQLSELPIDQLRQSHVGGIFRQVKAADVLKHLLTSTAQGLELNQEASVYGVDMVEPDQTTLREQIVVPHGTALPDLAFELQKNHGGIYNNDIGCFFQTNRWWVYPIFDLSRFDKARNTMTVISMPGGLLPTTERTYLYEHQKLCIVTTGAQNHHDPSNALQENKGSGVRFTKASELLNSYATTKDNKSFLNHGSIAGEFVTTPRESGFQNVPFSDRKITDNVAYELSKLSANNGQLIQFKWGYSNIDLVLPGMPVKYLFTQQNQVVTLYGTVLEVHEFTALNSPGITEDRYRSETSVQLFVGTPPTPQA